MVHVILVLAYSKETYVYYEVNIYYTCYYDLIILVSELKIVDSIYL